MAKSARRRLGKVVFGRIGYMHFYAGQLRGDERPRRGGSFNDGDIGSEVLNFKKRGQSLYGYFETGRWIEHKPTKTNLRRIDPTAGTASSLDDVLVIFVAPHRQRGQVIVGWYRSATVLGVAETRPAPDDEHHYRCVAKATDAVLLPEPARTYPILRGAGAMGQSNVCYALTDEGKPKNAPWIAKAVDYVRAYRGENLLVSKSRTQRAVG